jgi:hypothetical protein
MSDLVHLANRLLMPWVVGTRMGQQNIGMLYAACTHDLDA